MDRKKQKRKEERGKRKERKGRSMYTGSRPRILLWPFLHRKEISIIGADNRFRDLFLGL